MSIIVTGAAGFIGMHVAEALLKRGHPVVGVDSFTPYYDVALKEARVAQLQRFPAFRLERGDLADREWTQSFFDRTRAARFVHLAAQAGVRYSFENPHAYVDSNLVAFMNVLEGCRAHRTSHLVYASSSSVYGANTKVPFAVDDRVDRPVSLYAATKRANELLAQVYAHQFGIPMTGLRFFTVYGPWGRPDMAYYSFTRAILEGRPIPVFNHGQLSRDFTYVDDIVEGIVRLLDRAPPAAPELFNIGASTPVPLMEFIHTLERALGRKAILEMKPMQPGDVPATFADVSALEREVGFRPGIGLDEGLRRFAAWYRQYHVAPAETLP